MGDRISLALVFHNHQPVGNFGWVIAEAFERAYLPMVAALERHPSIRVGLHYTGPLLAWMRAERPDFLERLRILVEHDQVELLGGGFYEPVLASLPERDRLAQLTRMADAIEQIGGRRPAGAWLAERVWEPDVPTSIVDAGYRWTILDDAHFRAGAVDDSALWGAYTTEDQGRLLTVFGSDRQLRYAIPFGRVEDAIDHLLANVTAAGERLAVMGDDGEKFGSWPDTYEHCWGTDGWVERFFRALHAQRETIATVTPSGWLENHGSIGRVYLPTSSYFEMGEWALPAGEGLAFEDTYRRASADGASWLRWLRGGFWRNFQVKYREINDLHKQMLRVSTRVAAMPPGRARTLALDHLHQGQSNDCYWHGVFGGIYISHMRLATHEHLIAAEDLADLVARQADGGADTVDRTVAADTDLDGRDEILAVSPGQLVVIDPAEGGGIGTWDIRSVRHALTAVLRRRPEAYHARLVASAVGPASGTTGGVDADGRVGTIHDVVRSREPGLADRLHYDAYERRSGLVHLFAPGTTAAVYANGLAVELGDAHDGAYEVEAIGPGEVRLSRTVAWAESPGSAAVRVEKHVTMSGTRQAPTLELIVTVENRSARPVRFDLGLEWALTMLGGGGNPAAYYRVGAESVRHDSAGDEPDTALLISGNTFIGIELTTRFEPAAAAWWAPIETVSNSEFGFERVYQGSALVGLWPMELAAGERRTVAMRHLVHTTSDRSALELGLPD